MFLCLSVLEDPGYMARAAFVMDRLMRAVGLPGKAMIPMMLDFGCSVPAGWPLSPLKTGGSER